MDGISRLSAVLSDWSIQHGVTLDWQGDTLRLVDKGGTNRTNLVFPREFWDTFASASAYRRESAIDAMRLDVELQYDAEWAGAVAKRIDVPMVYVQELA